MAVDGWLIRRRMRARWPSTFALAAVVALTSLIAFLSIGTAQRTRDAYPDFLRRSRVGDLVINPSLVSTGIDRAIRDLPGVEAVTTDVLLLGTSTKPSFAGDTTGLDNLLQIRGSTDGRFDAMDRPAISAGRLPTGESEAFISEAVAKAGDLHLGDPLELTFGNAGDDVDLLSDGNITLAGSATVRIVGIGTLPDEVLPDGLYPRARILVSPDIIRRFTCPLVEVPAGASVAADRRRRPPGGLRAVVPVLLAPAPERPRRGRGGRGRVRRAGRRAQPGPPPRGSGRPGTSSSPPPPIRIGLQVARSVQPTTSALAVLGVAAAVLTLVLAGLAIARDLRRQRAEIRQWWRLGLARADRTRVVAASIVLGTTLGVALGLFGAWLLSPIGPVGSVRSVVPSPGRTVPSLVWVTAAALALLLGLIAVGLTVGAVRRPAWDDVEAVGGGRLARLWRSSTRPPVGEGFRAAFGSRRALLLVASTALTATMFVASAGFASSLTGLLSTPASYGWPWDVTVLTNVGYGPMDADAATAALDERADLADWATLGFSARDPGWPPRALDRRHGQLGLHLHRRPWAAASRERARSRSGPAPLTTPACTSATPSTWRATPSIPTR